MSATLDDTGPFVGPRGVPFDVHFASKILSVESEDGQYLIPLELLDRLADLCYDYTVLRKFSRRRYSAIRRTILDQWQTNDAIRSLKLGEQDFDRIFSGLMTVCRCVRQHFANHQQTRALILKQCKLPEPIFETICSKFFLDPSTCRQPNRVAMANWDWIATGNRLISVRWQLNLAISDRFLNKIMEPYVRFEFVTSHGSLPNQHKTTVFECRMKQFHQIRFTVAWLLRELARLESQKILQPANL